MVALFAAQVSMSAWLPWLATGSGGGGWANAISGNIDGVHVQHRFGTVQLIVLLSSALLVAGAVVGRGLSARAASIAAVAISLTLVGLMVRYYSVNVRPPVSAAYGLYIAGVVAVAALLCSVWALLVALRR
jgi:hypothetical protein